MQLLSQPNRVRLLLLFLSFFGEKNQTEWDCLCFFFLFWGKTKQSETAFAFSFFFGGKNTKRQKNVMRHGFIYFLWCLNCLLLIAPVLPLPSKEIPTFVQLFPLENWFFKINSCDNFFRDNHCTMRFRQWRIGIRVFGTFALILWPSKYFR